MRKIALLAVAGAALVGACSTGATVTSRDAVPDKAIVQHWPQQWCKARVGMTLDEVEALMGKAMQIADGQQDASWRAYQFFFIAFFNADGKVRQLDIDAGETEVPCAVTRTN
jgi:hypothetical protein